MGALVIFFGLVIYFVLMCRDTYKDEKCKSQSKASAIQRGEKYYFGEKGKTYSTKTDKQCYVWRKGNGKGYDIIDLKTSRKVDECKGEL